MARKPSRIRRTFTPQFKKDAVALVAGGRSVNAVAYDRGIARSLLQRWQTQLGREPEVTAAFPGTGRLGPNNSASSCSASARSRRSATS